MEEKHASETVSAYVLVREALKKLKAHGVELGNLYSTVNETLARNTPYPSTTDRFFPDEEEEGEEEAPAPRASAWPAESEEAKKKRLKKEAEEVKITREMKKVAKCLRRVTEESSFWCGGFVIPGDIDLPLLLPPKEIEKPKSKSKPKKKHIKWKSKQETNVLAGTWISPDVDSIINDIASPAPFGDLKTQTTVYDESVRKAWECPIDSTCKRPFIKNNLKKHILEAFKMSNVDLKPYKLNVYGVGGFFKPHVDTPVKGKRSIATLVVCLPVPFEGGELIVSSDGQEKVFDWGKRSSSGEIQWAAFFNDCIHEVKPVTKGWRVTLTFSILSAAAPKRKGQEDEEPLFTDEWESSGQSSDCSRASNQLNAAVSELSHNQFGLLLSHKYTQGGLNSDTLKGADKLLWEAFRKKTGWMCSLLPVVFRFEAESYPEESEVTRVRKVYAFSQADLEYLQSCPSVKEHYFDVIEEKDEKDILPKPTHGIRVPIPFMLVTKGEVLNVTHDAGSEYTGNEAAPEKTNALYYNAALILHKPRVGRVCSLFRICKAVLSWHKDLMPSQQAGSDTYGLLPEEVMERLKVGRKRRYKKPEESEEDRNKKTKKKKAPRRL